MLKDPSSRHKGYYHFKLASQFGLYAVDLFKQGRWVEGLRQMMKSGGVRSAAYYLYFFYIMKSIGLNRRIMP
jgi:hypothetical protein